MQGLHLHTSNRLEALFADLAAILSRPLPSVFEPEIVVVQSLGMRRWLSLRLAEAHGICANVQFPFPQTFIAEIFRRVLPAEPVSEIFDREILPWRIMRLLPSLAEKPEFADVRHYLSGEKAELKLYQLSVRIAEVFDRYLAFRPPMILDWDAGRERHWQAILWRKLASETAGGHLPSLGKELDETLRAKSVAPDLPTRVSIFGLSTLPEFYLQVMQSLARQTEIHLFVMEPTPEWWHEIISPREKAKLRQRAPKHTITESHLETGNPLLASMGKLGRDFLGLIADLEPVEYREIFVEPAAETLLAQMQREIFRLEEHAPGQTSPNEKSIQFHSCHTPIREMEVLHDQLLDLFQNDPTLQPNDVVVMMPDVAGYASYIDAVFATPESEHLHIPYTIADRTTRATSSVVDVFLALLELSQGRFGASSVLNILESRAVQQRFQLAESDLETIRAWLEKAAIRWGIDAAHRTQFDVPAFAQNSWREGLDRLLLGYALPLGGQALFHGLLPVDEIEGDLAETLGNFVEFIESLFFTADELKVARSLRGWRDVLRQLVDRFFAPSDEVERELAQVRRVLDSLGTAEDHSALTAPIAFDVLIAHLQRSLGDAESPEGFMVGRVTFCALKPMRSIPFRIVCLAGMNDTAYPRKSPTLGFDLIAQHPRPGDRSTRDDDRYLFLEAILSARDYLLISYLGQSIRDNTQLPPSVLVSELIDYLGGDERVSSLVTQHKLQPFNPAYFCGDNQLFSYSPENCRASCVTVSPRVEPPVFFDGPLARPEDNFQVVNLSDLFSFYRSPCKFFLRQRLGISLPNDEPLLEESEPFSVDGLKRYLIEQRLLAQSLVEVTPESLELVTRATGQLPPGRAGDSLFGGIVQRVTLFAETLRRYAAAPSPPHIVDLRVGQRQVSGRIDQVTEDGLLFYRLTKIKPFDYLQAWISHLILNSETSAPTRLLTEDSQCRFAPISTEVSQQLLSPLLDIYVRGQSRPVPYFPRTSLAFAEQKSSPIGKKTPRAKALGEWDGSGWEVKRPEMNDSYIALAYRHAANPLDEEWEKLALAIFQPLLDAREAIE